MRLLISPLLRLPHLLLIAAFATTPFVWAPWHAAHAQSASDEAEAEQEAMDAQKKAEARKAARRAAPPSALPGADADDSDSGHSRMDVNPTAALFDAINRGSLVAAKEALNRGADLEARNVLEQTPLDLAIDLGRNDIMFLLLSLRTYNPDGRIMTDVSHGDISQDHGNGHINVNAKNGISAIAPAKHIVSDGGHPQPEYGFLGFGAEPTPATYTPHRAPPHHIQRSRRHVVTRTTHSSTK
ncbi:ankyrin repeat domain-containing protein [Saccharibacter sp. 17.LH.SD]|uniref:ankyrin repeat domain-containing protein n=1 Tax=Saccharibacter sp. 17.LH.SD TaxID=2689393 RepID=UPI00137196F2|nr:ankyrin repeat domain-containing protein [Saccharibacter sp. 17.LH.SD]MXV44802.1 ankyrin repeat domain-containing protein [Saccharibacter sp. 17.LH.SD]